MQKVLNTVFLSVTTVVILFPTLRLHAEPSPQQSTPTNQTSSEPRVTVSEVQITGVDGALQDEVYRVIQTQPGKTTTRSQLQSDIDAILATGFFARVQALPEDTPLGVRITFAVESNPVLRSVQVEGAQVLSTTVVQSVFKPQYGKVLNQRDLQAGIQQINQWYQDNGYTLAQIMGAPSVQSDGTVILQVAEGMIERFQIRFINREGNDRDAKGNPIQGQTRDFIITRELQLKPGEVFNRNELQRDLQRVFGLGIFEDLKLSLEPAQDPRQVVVVLNVVERNNRQFSPSATYSSRGGFGGGVSVAIPNFGGNNQNLNTNVQVAQRDQQFDLSFNDPWIAGDPFRTSYSVQVFRNQNFPLVFEEGEREVRIGNAERDRPRLRNTGGAISFFRPLSGNVFERSDWTASVGLKYRRATITDEDNIPRSRDELGNRLTFSGTPNDDLLTTSLGLSRDLRNNPVTPTRGSLLRLSTEQSLPVGSGSILMNRLQASYSVYIPTRLTRFTAGCRDRRPTELSSREDCPQAFSFNIQGGTILGDLPPYEAFSLGGGRSVRGYEEGSLGSGRSYLRASAEYNFPLFSIIGGSLFVDAATDLGSSQSVPGNPAGVREKSGSGFGYGVGVRIQSPIGPIRLDYGINDQGNGRFQFSLGG